MPPKRKPKSQLSKSGKKYIFLYKTTNIINNKIYIGYHSTNNLSDGYIGCGVRSQAHADGAKKYGLKSAFINAVCKYKYSSFSTEILEFFDDIESVKKRESEVVNIDFVLKKNNYNIAIGGFGGGEHTRITTDKTEEIIKRMYKKGTRFDCICNIFNITRSVIHRICKDLDTYSPRVKTKRDYFIDNWIEKNSEYYISKYKNRELTKHEIRDMIPFDLYKRDFLKGVDKVDKYYVLYNNTRYTFSKTSKIEEILGVKLFNSGIRQCANNKISHYKGFNFNFNTN